MWKKLEKLMVMIIGMSLIVFLCGFCSAHDWLPATCEKPETCSVCGASRGEPLGHQWSELKNDLFDTPVINELYSRTCELCGAVLHPIRSGRWNYRILDDGTAEIVSVYGNLNEVVIPEYIDGIKVTSIGEEMLYGEYNVWNVVIPEGITTIGENAFTWCEGLAKLHIPSSVTTIVGNPFALRYGKTITVSPDNPNFEIIDGVLFERNDKRMIYRPDREDALSYAVPEGTQEIGTRAFLGGEECTLKEIILPNSLKAIDDYAFEGCHQLERIDIPEGVTSIGYQILPEFGYLETISIPSSVSEMNGNPFQTHSVKVVLSPDNPYYEMIDGVLFDKRNNSLVAYLYDTGEESYIIPDGTTEICAGAFSGCRWLTKITIPDSVTAIGDEAFQECNNLVKIVIPEGITEIGEGVFSQCENLKAVNLPDSLKKIEKNAFLGCSSLEKIIIPQGVTVIDDGAFQFCKNLSNVSLPVGLTKIGSEAFESTAIERIDIPQGVKYIGNGAFCMCFELECVSLPEGLASIGRYAFAYCHIEEITVPDGVAFIGYGAFSCSGLDSISLPNSLKTIDEAAFISNAESTIDFTKIFSAISAMSDFLLDNQQNGDSPAANVENTSPLSAYLPKAIRAREQTLQLGYTDQDFINRNTQGILIDWDEDGVEELFLSYFNRKSWYGIQKIGIYDIEDGKVKTIIEDMQSEAVYAVGMRGFSGVTQYQGKPAVFSCAFHEYTSEMSDRTYQTVWAKFTLWDLRTQETLHKADISCDGHHLSYKIDGKPCTESDFVSIIDNCSFLTYDPAPREPYMTYSLSFIPIDELIELLGDDTSSPNAKESAQEKQLSQIKQIESNGNESIVSFQYDSNGRLVSSKGSGENIYTYSYDEKDHLIEVNCTYWEPYGAMYEYRYDDNGFLIEISGIGEGGGIAYTLENDEQGRVKRKIRSYDFGTAVTEYFYSDNGTHVEEVTTDTHSVGPVYQGKSSPQETAVKTTSVDYTYDDQGRVLSETRTSDGKVVCTTYDYSYPPLIFVCDENGMPYRCEIRDCAGIQIWYMVIGKCPQSIECGSDGSLSRIICDEADYQFLFSCEENPDWALEQDKFAATETEDTYDDSTTKDTSEVQYVVGYVVNAESGLNVRQNPSTSSERVRRIHNGTRVLISEQVTIDGMLWGRISDGWICMNYVKLEEEESSWGVRYIVSPSAGLVNIRCEAGTSYESIERISGGKEVMIYEQKTVDGREWGKTDTGWICMEYLTRSP